MQNESKSISLVGISENNGTDNDDINRWNTFSKEYRKLDKKAWLANNNGTLQKVFSIRVHDYGITRFEINGMDSKRYIPRPIFQNVNEMINSFPVNFFNKRPEWAHVRWIDITGINGEAIQYFLYCFNCERQYTFNYIVDLKQRPMCIVLDNDNDNNNNNTQDEEKENKNIESEPADPSDAIVNFLLITKVPCLSPKAVVAEEGSLRGSKLYDLRNKEQNNEIELDIVQYEQITYLMNLDTQSNTGTLISFEEGMLYISSNQ